MAVILAWHTYAHSACIRAKWAKALGVTETGPRSENKSWNALLNEPGVCTLRRALQTSALGQSHKDS